MTDANAQLVTVPPHLDHEALALAQRETLSFESLADLFRQIGHDERVHKQESLAQMRQAHFR
jgi:hypothetical protein